MMFGKNEMTYTVTETGADSFTVKAAVSHRSGEEVASDDISRSQETLIGVTKRDTRIHRGQTMTAPDGSAFKVQYSVNTPRYTVLHLSRPHFEG